MDYRNSGRSPRRRRDRVYCPPGRRLEERREQLRGYAGFSFREQEENTPRDDRRNPQYTGERYEQRERREREFDSRNRFDSYDEQYSVNARGNRGDDRYDHRREDQYSRHDEYRDPYDRYHDRNDAQDRYGQGGGYTDDYYDDAAEYGAPPFAVPPGYPLPYPVPYYPPYDPYGGFMDEEDYNEFLEYEEFEDRYGRDFDRYNGEEPKAADKTQASAPKTTQNPPQEKSEPIITKETKVEENMMPAEKEEVNFIDFEDDFDDDADDFAPVNTREEPSVVKEDADEAFFSQYSVRPRTDREKENGFAGNSYRQKNDFEPDFFNPEPERRQKESAEIRQKPVQRRAPVVPEFIPSQPATTAITKYLVIAVALMCLLGGWMVSSGHIIEGDSVRKTQRMASFDLQTGFDSMFLNVMNDVRGLPKVYTLPLSETPANKPRESGFSNYTDDSGVRHDTYVDDTISVDVSRSKYTIGEYTVIANVAKVKIAHPTQLRSAFAGGQFGSTRTRLSKLAQSYNAVVGINGELYNHTGRYNILIRQGTMYRETLEDKYTLFIDSNGDFIIRIADEAVANGILNDPENKIYQTVSFGPALVIDGVKQYREPDDTHFAYRNPRSAIGQTGPLEYVMVSVEGRSAESKGLDVNHLATLMYDLGCIQAYNLDGGQSSEVVFNGKPYNKISNSGERQFSDLLYFGTALPEE